GAAGCNDVRKVAQSMASEGPASRTAATAKDANENVARSAPQLSAATALGISAPTAAASTAETALPDDLADDGSARTAERRSRRSRPRGSPQVRRRRAGSGRDGHVLGRAARVRGDDRTEPTSKSVLLQVARLIVSRGISGREPLGPATA